jgi:hypothetical protein
VLFVWTSSIGAFALSLRSFAATHDDGATLLPDQFEVPYCYVMQAASQGREGGAIDTKVAHFFQERFVYHA